MNAVNRTLYIPLYGKAQMSKKNIILHDTKAEAIWEKEGFALKGKAKSKWLTYFMAMRAKVFDEWTKKQMEKYKEAVVLHIGCGMDSRVERIGNMSADWYDIDFPSVIAERKKYYTENSKYHMLGADAAQTEWIACLPKYDKAVVILEGVSMYLQNEEVVNLFLALQDNFEEVALLMDVYTVFGAKASKYKNPIHDVGVTQIYGVDSPKFVVKNDDIQFVKEHSMTPEYLVNELKGFDKSFFRFMFTGKMVQKIYRLLEYRIGM